MAHHELIDHKGGGMEARFYVDGKRVSREEYETLQYRAYACGSLNCFRTKARPVGEGGKTRRTNYCTVNV